MNFSLKTLPNDPVILKQMLYDLKDNYESKILNFEKLKKDYEKKLKQSNLLNDWLEEKVAALLYKLFGKKSEKLGLKNKDQFLLFNEAELYAETKEQLESDKTKISSYVRHKRGRKPIPGFLKREDVIHDLTPEEKQCPCCGKERKCIGSDDTEELHFIPAKIKVLRHKVMKYGACDCEGFFEAEITEIKSAKKPPRLIPGSIAGASLLAQTITAKYADGLPFYRQEKIFKRHGINIPRATMCNWTISAARECRNIIALMRHDTQCCKIINMDETTVQVLKEPGRPPDLKSYMWIMVGSITREKRTVLFEYDIGRSGKIAGELLGNFSGYLQTDGYKAYNRIGQENGRTHVACLAHIRRKFFTIIESNKKKKLKIKSAEEALEYIRRIYHIEKCLRKRNLSADSFIRIRKEKMLSLLDEFSAWLLKKQSEVPPKSSLGKAVNYALSEWKKFIRFLDSALLTPDNNVAENAIRPFVIGRKNWLFSNTPRGAAASGVMYSLIESARINGLEPFKYLYFLFKNLPLAESDKEVRKLLPYNLKLEDIEPE